MGTRRSTRYVTRNGVRFRIETVTTTTSRGSSSSVTVWQVA